MEIFEFFQPTFSVNGKKNFQFEHRSKISFTQHHPNRVRRLTERSTARVRVLSFFQSIQSTYTRCVFVGCFNNSCRFTHRIIAHTSIIHSLNYLRPTEDILRQLHANDENLASHRNTTIHRRIRLV